MTGGRSLCGSTASAFRFISYIEMSEEDKQILESDGANEVLLHLIGDGDEVAFAMLYDRMAGWVYSLAISIVRNVTDAEEVTQDVFLRIWDRAEAFNESRGSVAAWLATVTRRLAIDKTRSKQFRSAGREVTLDIVSEIQNSAVGGGNLESEVKNRSASRQIMAAMQNLNDPLREVIQLAYYDGLSHTRIAERLKTPLGTVKSRIREAMTQLRRVLL